MIRFFIKNGNNSLKFDAPTDELFDHLGSIGIFEDIPITCSEKIYLDFYPTDDNDKIAQIVCDRLLPEDMNLPPKCGELTLKMRALFSTKPREHMSGRIRT